MIIGDAFLRIRPEGSQFTPETSKVVETGLGDIAKKGAQLLGGMFAGAGLISAAKQGIEELKESATASSNVESVIRATGESAHVTADQVDELAQSQMALTGVDDEVIKTGAAKLLTFRNVKDEVGTGNDVFTRATKAGLDLAQVGFGTPETAALMLGKALNDPIKGMAALGRAGVTFSSDQKAAIKSLVDTGDLLGAQKVILGEVEHQVGGAAEAFGKTLPGQMQIAQESLKNTEATLVGGAAPAMQLLAQVTTAAANAVEALPGPLRDLATIGVAAGVGVFAIARPLSGLVDIYTTLAAKRAAGAVVAEGATVAEGQLAAANVVTSTSAAGLIVTTDALTVSEGGAAVATDALTGSTYALRTAMAVSNLPLIGALASSAAVLGGVATAFAGASAYAAIYAMDLLDPGASTDALKAKTGELGTTLAHLPEGTNAAVKGVRDYLGALSDVDAQITATKSTGLFPGDPMGDNETAVKFSDILKETQMNVDGLLFHIEAGPQAFDQWKNSLLASGQITDQTGHALDTLQTSVEDQARAAVNAARDNGTLTQGQYDYIVAANTAEGSTTNWTAALGNVPAAAQATKIAAFDLRDAVNGDADALDQAKTMLDAYNNALRASVDPLFAVQDAERGVAEARKASDEAAAKVWYQQTRYNNAVRDFGRNSPQAAAALGDLAAAQDDANVKTEAAGKAALDLNAASAQLIEQVRLHPETWQAATTSIDQWAQQGLITTAQADQLKQQLGGVALGAEQLQGRSVDMALHLDNTQALKAAIDFQHQIEQIPDVLLSDKGTHRATGGMVLGSEPFYAAEQGFEILTSPGWRRAPVEGGNVLSHTQSQQYLTGLSRQVGSAGTVSTTTGGSMAHMVDNRITATIERVVTPDPVMSAVVIGRSLRGLRHRMTRRVTS